MRTLRGEVRLSAAQPLHGKGPSKSVAMCIASGKARMTMAEQHGGVKTSVHSATSSKPGFLPALAFSLRLSLKSGHCRRICSARRGPWLAGELLIMTSEHQSVEHGSVQTVSPEAFSDSLAALFADSKESLDQTENQGHTLFTCAMHCGS
jgi:hypothetical protein